MWIGLAFFGFTIGTILGSFAKALADRLRKQNSLRGRSYCEACKHKLAWYDLFPVVSYLMLKGKCRYCHQKIPVSNFLAEISLGVLIVIMLVTSNFDMGLLLNPTINSIVPLSYILFKIFIITILFILLLTDIKTGLLPDKITYPSIGIATGYWFFISSLSSWLLYEGLKISPIGKYLLPPYSNYVWTLIYRVWQPVLMAIASGIVLSLFFALLIIITKGKGMGWGDVKFVLFIGIALGFPNSLIAVLLAFLTGAIFSIGLIVFGKKSFGQTIPFGPFLSLGAYIALLWGSQILGWYLKVGIK